MWTRVGIVLIAAVAFMWPFAGIARAAEVSQTLYLDQGFVGRPASFDLFNGKVKVSWGASDLTAPTSLTISLEQAPTSSRDGFDLGPDVVHLSWADSSLMPAAASVTFKGCVNDAWTDCRVYRDQGIGAGDILVRVGIHRSTYMRTGMASWYAYKKCNCAASVDFPKGTRVRVRSVMTGKSIVVRINDYGPERDKFPERAIDLDKVAFMQLAPRGAGVVKVTVEPVLKTDPDYKLADAPAPKEKTIAVKLVPVNIPPVATVWSY